MTSKINLSILSGVAAAAVTVMAAGTANATFGMLPHCYGTVKCAMGGAGSAKAGAAVDAVINPALAADMGNEYQVNAGWFWADVKGKSSYAPATMANGETSSADSFPNMSMAVNYKIDDTSSFNLALVPGGGGASKWATSRTANLGSAVVDQEITYEMIYLQPTYAMKVGNANYGVGGILSYATIKTDSRTGAFGLSGVEDQKAKWFGAGFQVGGKWGMGDKGTAALNLRSPVWHQKADNYDGSVFNDPIDTPAQIQAGVAFDATDSTTVAFDVKWVEWSQGNTIGNEPNLSNTAARGFGWKNQTIIMLGLEHKLDDATTLRAGYSHGNSPIEDGGVLANYLFPAITTDHFTAGGSYNMGGGMELGMSAYYSPKASQCDDQSKFGIAAHGTCLSHQQQGFQLSFKNDF
ncbi:OmpP1/FadL family transporter [Pseudomonadota bacterium]